MASRRVNFESFSSVDLRSAAVSEGLQQCALKGINPFAVGFNLLEVGFLFRIVQRFQDFGTLEEQVLQKMRGTRLMEEDLIPHPDFKMAVVRLDGCLIRMTRNPLGSVRFRMFCSVFCLNAAISNFSSGADDQIANGSHRKNFTKPR